ncbi:hypothetical protein B0H11DRAFT_2237401 [Mycena galericulata]|nr:hypothetical protein B0H11DRAFT_2237401 [Mycena galericulata]
MPSNTDSPLYPFPSLGNYDSEGRHLVAYEELDGLKKKEYQTLCKKYRLPHSYGNISDLRQRLLNLSSDRDSWAALVPGATRLHLGPRVGSKTKKKSTLRWEAKDRSDPSNATRTVSAVQKGMSPVVWAMKVCSMALPNLSKPPSGGTNPVHPATVPSNPHVIAEGETSSDPVFPSNPASGSYSNPSESLDLGFIPSGHDASAAVSSMSTFIPTYPQTSHIAFHALGAQHHRPLPLVLGSVPECTDPFPVAPVPFSEYTSVDRAERPEIPEPTYQLMFSVPSPRTGTPSGHEPSAIESLHSVLGTAPSPNKVGTRTIYLKTGPLVLTEAHVPDPPVFNAQLRGPMDKVLKNILRWWDDRRPEWDSECALLKVGINGEKVGVPGVLWKELYGSPWKANQWVGLKVRYSELLCIMNYYDHLIDEGRTDDFWAPITSINDKGERVIMRYSKAVTTLRTRRTQMIQEQAAELLRDSTLDGRFSYKRSGKVVSMRDASAIIKRARNMKIPYPAVYLN